MKDGEHQQVDLGRIALVRHDYDGDWVTVYETSGRGLWSATIRFDELAKLLVRVLNGYVNETDRNSYVEERAKFDADFGVRR